MERGSVLWRHPPPRVRRHRRHQALRQHLRSDQLHLWKTVLVPRSAQGSGRRRQLGGDRQKGRRRALRKRHGADSGDQIGVNAENEIKALGISQSATYGYVNDSVRINASLYQPPGVTGTIEWFRDGALIAGATTAAYDFKITDADTGGTSKNTKFKAKLTAGGKSVETGEINVLAIKRGTPVLSPGFVTVEFFNTIDGTAVQALYDADKFINNTPDETRVLAALDTPNGYAENYGARVTGFILPQETAQYRFFIRSDDASELYLNTTAGGPAPVPDRTLRSPRKPAAAMPSMMPTARRKPANP